MRLYRRAPSVAADRYRVEDSHCGAYRFRVLDELSGHVDSFQTDTAATYFAGLLNRGQARICSHACIGCRVEPI